MNEQNSILPEITGLAAGIIIGAMIMVIVAVVCLALFEFHYFFVYLGKGW